MSAQGRGRGLPWRKWQWSHVLKNAEEFILWRRMLYASLKWRESVFLGQDNQKQGLRALG